jgi:DeoR family suf operon transcriptional repressor
VESKPDAVGPGRPINRWRLTDRGRHRFPDSCDHFALGLMHALASRLPAETMRTLLQHQAIEKAQDYRRRIGNGSLQDRLEKLVRLRRDEGYLTELHPFSVGSEPHGGYEGVSDSGSWVISDSHCSIIRIAEEFPIICDQELQLIRHTFPDCMVDRVHWRLQEGHTCGFRLSPLPSPDVRRES